MNNELNQVVRKALEANHQWHKDNDDYGGYNESELCNLNLAAISALDCREPASPLPAKGEVVDKSEELVNTLRGFGKAYPEDMFRPMGKETIAAIHAAYPGAVDRISAAMGRHMAKFMEQAADMIEALCRCATSSKVEAMPATQEPKYGVRADGLYNRASGETIPHDEPVFIFRARDRKAIPALLHYVKICQDPDHKKAVLQRIADFNQFAHKHTDRLKYPDTVLPGKAEAAPISDEDILEVWRQLGHDVPLPGSELEISSARKC